MKLFFKSASADSVSSASVSTPLAIHAYLLGGTGSVSGFALIQNILAATKADGYPSVDLCLTTIDLDIASDSKGNIKCFANAFGPIARELADRQDTSGILGCLRSVQLNEVNLSQQEYQKTTEEFVLSSIPAPEQESVRTGFRLISPDSSCNSILGNGGQGDPLVGYVVSISHMDELRALLQRDLEQAQNDPSRAHSFLIINSFIGSTGYNLAPLLLQIFSEYSTTFPVYQLIDGGLFQAHSAAYSSPDYLGCRDVAAKSEDAMNELNDRQLFDCLTACIVMMPTNPSRTPYKLCPVNKLKGEQHRHTCVENLIAANDILNIICQTAKTSERYHYLSGNPVLVLSRDPDTPDRPLSWEDLGLNGERFLRLIRKLTLGAATRNVIWNQDDTLIANIPAISSIMEKGFTLPQIKASGEAIADSCRHLLQQFYDYVMTGTNFELEHTEDFLPIATYRLMNHQTVRNILDGSQNLNFSPGILESYRQSIGTAPHFHEKLTKPNNRFNTSIKSLIDRIRTASSVEDFYIRLFQTQ